MSSPRSTELRRAIPTFPVARYLRPPCTSFELHLLVPKAKSCLSTRTTFKPREAASKAMPVPGMPAPITRTSTCPSPAARAARSFDRRALFNDEDLRLTQGVSVPVRGRERLRRPARYRFT